MNNRILLAGLLCFLFCANSLFAQDIEIIGPDKRISVMISLEQGRPVYSVNYDGKLMLEKSPLGLITNVSDLSSGLKLMGQKDSVINKTYTENRIKKSQVNYSANEKTISLETEKKERLDIIFRVSNNDIAFRYFLPRVNSTARCIVEKELTGFDFPSYTTTFLTPQATPMIGWEHTKPSYEEGYTPDAPVGTASQYGIGYTFPGLFRVGSNGWALVSETGVNSAYCGSRLSEGTKEGLYSIAFPHPGENNGLASSTPGISLPGTTPWRTITVGNSLKPIVETTVPFDLVEPLYKPSIDYKFGRSTWSWLEWQDNSINFADQKTFVDLSASMGYEFVLVDNWWDTRIGKEKIEELARYAKSKNVSLCLWYNSNGYWSDAPQGPKNKMNTSAARKKEMEWMKSIGIKGIKVDFFGGDKQETMQLYEDILSDANDYGLVVIFHGCTLPRGWERMFPNFVGSEAVLASENLIFTQQANDNESFNASLHPFIRNAVGSMDFGPVLLNKRHNRANNGGTTRKTTDIFQLATAVIFQTPVQNFGITPNNLKEFPAFVIDFMKSVPSTWDETIFIDGYPGKYVVLARRHQDRWYVAGINAEKTTKELTLDLPMLKNKKVVLYSDDKGRQPQLNNLKQIGNGRLRVKIQPEGGVIVTSE